MVTMSGKGGTPFFDAPDFVKGDGIQADPPADTFADPLSGLVTTGTAAQANPSADADEVRVQVPGPVQHDPEVVSKMVNAAMLADDRPTDGQGPEQTVDQPPAKIVSTVGEQGAAPIGILPQQRTWPSRPSQLIRQPRRVKQEEPVEVDEEAEVEVQRAKRSMQMPRIGKPSSNTAGVMIAIALMVVFAVLAIQLLASLFSSIAGIFG
ncbi:hypothetical protein B0293_00390 [Amycolatopsis azurea DSM 43854]|uniref:Uncharacterized protein n=2 Tax=Amycolatopsis azurea TaxID=36819 RepID=M2NT58_9PSEU|nr:hypothetical protein C791_4664 [Amycolatopsis azurea DSM 43854]OOC08420.1 hypothetical protein B0293_00390 [Amycolatopsis azurea DSM 43854]